MAKKPQPKPEHVWEIICYQLSADRLEVFITEHCKECGQRRKYERPNKRLSPAA